MTREFCAVANDRCAAPCGVAVNGALGSGTVKTRGRCHDCGDACCTGPLCSRVLPRGDRHARVCFYCAGEPQGWTDELIERERRES